jgi:ribosomal protein L9
MAKDQKIQYVTAPKVDDNRKKYCRFKKNGIKYIDYKDANFLLKFINDQGKIFGAVNTIMIADALKQQGFDVDRRRITFETEPKFVGDYVANLNLHKEVKVKVPFEVVAE